MNGAPTAQELSLARQWVEASFAAAPTDRRALPASFRYAGREPAGFLRRARSESAQRAAEPGVTRTTTTFADPRTGLELRCEIAAFAHFPVVEWVAHLRNNGGAETRIISDILPLDAGFEASREEPCQVHHALGSDCKLDDFAPRLTPLPPGSHCEIAPFAGRSSEGALPFFNLEMGGRGIIGAIGWSGGWRVSFDRDAQGKVRVRAGMRDTRLRLLPGEEIRTPRIMLLFWEGDRIHGHNMLRQFLLAHHAPRPGGKLLQAPVCFSVWGENTAPQQVAKARWLKDNGIEVDAFWIDAGWYGNAAFKEDSTVFASEWYSQVGNWFPNRTTYPQGLAPVGAALREMGLGFVLWFEPERVFKDTWLAREHPEWLLGPVGDNYLFNLGLPEARRMLTDLISSLISEGGITIYRHDFNMDPAPFWRAADGRDRVGMSEIRHIEGLYAMWDELLARHPGLVIDNCSSGGRRIDLETISRSIPLWRSDFQCFPGFDPIAIQGQTQGLAPWVPLSTGCCDRPTTYALRSALGPGLILTTNEFERDPPPSFPAEWLRHAVAEQQTLRPYFYGDFYPLLSYSLADDTWAAWQFDRPDLGEGMVLALRRQNSPFTTMQAALRGLEPQAQYEVRSRDGGAPIRTSGRDLMSAGLTIEISEKPGSALFTYRRVG